MQTTDTYSTPFDAGTYLILPEGVIEGFQTTGSITSIPEWFLHICWEKPGDYIAELPHQELQNVCVQAVIPHHGPPAAHCVPKTPPL